MRLLILISTCALGACGLAPERPAAPAFDEAAAFSRPYPTDDGALEGMRAWWKAALSESLSTSVQRAMQNSPALRVAAADVDAARAELRQAEADLGPDLSADANAGVRKVSNQSRTSSRTLGIDGTVPLDISGALDARRRVARLNLSARQADAAQLASDLARDLLLAAIDAAEARQRRALLERQTDLSARLLRLIELRFTQGLASSVDVLQQRDELAELRQQLPIADLDAQSAANRVRGLSGLSPGQITALDLRALPGVRARFSATRPMDLLVRRPALRAGSARLEAADAEFAAALADRWPEISLSAGALTRVVSGDVTSIVNAAIDATLTLFDGGRKLAVAEQRRAQLVAAGQQFLGDWIDAVIEADTLIHEESSLRDRIALSDQRLATAEALLKAAQRRYERGVSDYLPVLAALRGLQQQQRDHLSLQAGLARARVRLHHALGYVPNGDLA